MYLTIKDEDLFHWYKSLTTWYIEVLGIPENNLALRNNVFPPSTWRCEAEVRGLPSCSERLHACLLVCLAKADLSVFNLPSFFLLCMIINTSKFIQAFCHVFSCLGVDLLFVCCGFVNDHHSCVCFVLFFFPVSMEACFIKPGLALSG